MTLAIKSIGFIWIIFENPKTMMTKQNNLIHFSR